VRCLQTEATVNESGDPLLALCKAERQVRELRQELAMRDMLSGRGRVVYEDLSEGERAELQQLVLRFLAGAEGWRLGGCVVAASAPVPSQHHQPTRALSCAYRLCVPGRAAH
jgi:hypothetical protein